MNVEQSMVRKLHITNVDGLDPITVFTENFAPGKGKITIECYGESWTSFWPAMGSSIEQFFISIDNDYAIKNLAGGIRAEVDDEAAIETMIKQQVLKKRLAREIDKPLAWAAYHEVTTLDELKNVPNFCLRLFDCEWYHLQLPQTPNPDYTYLERICNAVRAALIEVEAKEAA